MLVTVAVSVSTYKLLAVTNDALITEAVIALITLNDPDTVKLPVTNSVDAVMFCTYKFVTKTFDAVTWLNVTLLVLPNANPPLFSNCAELEIIPPFNAYDAVSAQEDVP